MKLGKGSVLIVLFMAMFFGSISSAHAESQLTTVNLAKALWRGDPEIPEQLKGVDYSFIVFTLQTIHGEDMGFLDKAGREFKLQAEGEPDVAAYVSGGFSTKEDASSGFGFAVRDEASMKIGVPYTLVPPDLGGTYKWVGGGVTIIRTAGAPSNGNSGGQKPGTPASLDRLEASERELLMTAGQTRKIRIFAIMSDAKEKEITKDRKTVYRTNAASVADVAAGTIKAGKQEGSAVITISYDGKKVTLPVTVSKNIVTKIQANVKELTLSSDETQQIRLMATYSDGSVKDITSLAVWSTDNASAADVDGGEIIGRDPGQALITASYNGLTAEISVEVTPAYWDEANLREAVGLEVSNKNIKMKVNEDKVLQVYAVYDDGTKEEVTDSVLWQTSKSDVADINEGVLSAGASGRATITANFGSLSVNVSVEVEKQKPVKSLTASAKRIVLKKEEEKEVQITALFTDGTKANITADAEWSVKNDQVALAEEGLIVANKKGTTVVTARYNGKIVNILVQVK